MKRNLIIRSSAELDISDAALWYEEKAKKLGNRFLNDLEQTYKTIVRNPLIYRPVYKHYRRALLRKFPYGIYYFLDHDTIIVIAVYHEKRDPDSWKERA